MSKIKETKVYNINDFVNWYQANELELSPKYQRNPVWNLKAKSYLIDTILRGMPIPQIFIRQTIDTKTRKTMREVIDGQQRLRTILEFVNNDFAIMKSHNSELANMTYDDLDEELVEALLDYELPVEVIKVKDDSIIYDMFARLNTNSMTLNQQELRNAKYWGDFKVFVYRIAAKWREFFIDIKMFDDKQFSRMIDIEYVSSLIILLIDGVTSENQQKINEYYEKYDEEFELLDIIEDKFENVLYIIKSIFNDDKFSTRVFHRRIYFYTLFAMITHYVYKIPNIDCNRVELFSLDKINGNIGYFVKRLMEFESYFDRFQNDLLYDNEMLPDMIKFEQYHRTRTTAQVERKVRISILCSYIERGLNE